MSPDLQVVREARRYAAPREVLFEAISRAKIRAQWLSPSDAIQTEVARFDFLLGGWFRLGFSEGPALQEPWIAALKNATSARLSGPVPNSPTGSPNETVGSLLVALAFHEAYHLGQTGVLRRVLGIERLLP